MSGQTAENHQRLQSRLEENTLMVEPAKFGTEVDLYNSSLLHSVKCEPHAEWHQKCQYLSSKRTEKLEAYLSIPKAAQDEPTPDTRTPWTL